MIRGHATVRNRPPRTGQERRHGSDFRDPHQGPGSPASRCGVVPPQTASPSVLAPNLSRAVPPTPRQTPPARKRLTGLSIGVWLVLGFALVIGAFVAASVLAMRSTRNAT